MAPEPLGQCRSAAGLSCSSRIRLLIADHCSDCSWRMRTSPTSVPPKMEVVGWLVRLVLGLAPVGLLLECLQPCSQHRHCRNQISCKLRLAAAITRCSVFETLRSSLIPPNQFHPVIRSTSSSYGFWSDLFYFFSSSKTRLQSFFMLTTVHPYCFASAKDFSAPDT